MDRILKARAAEARLAEQARLQREEERAKALEAEARKEEERTRQAETEQAKNKNPAMPGGFNQSPPRWQKPHDLVPAPQAGATPPISTFFKSFTRHLGFDNSHRQIESMQNMLSGGSGGGVSGGGGSGGGGSGGSSSTSVVPQDTTVKSPEDVKPPPQKPTKPHVLMANLQSAIAASRAHNSNQVFSHAQTQQVQEQKTYCDRS